MTLEEGHLEKVSCDPCMEMKRLFVYVTLTFITPDYSADGMASECTGVAELT